METGYATNSPVKNRIGNGSDKPMIADRVRALDEAANELEETLKIAYDRLQNVAGPSHPTACDKRAEEREPQFSQLSIHLGGINERLRDLNANLRNLLDRCEC